VILGMMGAGDAFFFAEIGAGEDGMGALTAALDVALVFFLRLFLFLPVFGIEVEVDAVDVLTLGTFALDVAEDVRGFRDTGAGAALVSPPLRIIRARGSKVDDAEDCILL